MCSLVEFSNVLVRKTVELEDINPCRTNRYHIHPQSFCQLLKFECILAYRVFSAGPSGQKSTLLVILGMKYEGI